jgi:CheY-like chemotaxis protein
MTQSMLRHFGRRVERSALATPGRLVAEVWLPSATLAPVLVVEGFTLIRSPCCSAIWPAPPIPSLPSATQAQTLALAVQHRPCAVVLDVMMPEMDGWAVLMQLRQDERMARCRSSSARFWISPNWRCRWAPLASCTNPSPVLRCWRH